MDVNAGLQLYNKPVK